ncbi:MAG: hypothetical protein Q9Q40_06845 [Acidobacteriota bacterium]|nr:hypothetical protein [Acidobacteriota bacterium]MDQ7088282.1 hypothetical protein [Acidobacteriota bacterium]
MSRRAAGLWVLLLLGGAVGCAGARRAATPPETGGCIDYRLRARWEAPPGERSATARIALRHCPSGGIVFEVRGRVAGAVLAGAAGGGRLRLLFPRRRVVVDGADTEATWKRWTGLPLTAALLEDLLRGREPETLGTWRRVPESEADLEVLSQAGGRLRLWKTRQRPSGQGFRWPAVPAGWRLLDDGAAASSGEGGA